MESYAATTNEYEYKFCDLEIGKGNNENQKEMERKREDKRGVLSVLGKRKFDNAYPQDTYDDLRYGRHIDNAFFQNNYGSNCNNWENLEEGEIYEPEEIRKAVNVDIHLDVQKILSWCEQYLANKRLQEEYKI